MNKLNNTFTHNNRNIRLTITLDDPIDWDNNESLDNYLRNIIEKEIKSWDFKILNVNGDMNLMNIDIEVDRKNLDYLYYSLRKKETLN